MATNRDILTADFATLTLESAGEIMAAIAKSGMPTGLSSSDIQKAKANVLTLLSLFDRDNQGKYIGVRTFTGFIAQVLLTDGFADAIPAKYVGQSLGWIRRVNVDKGDPNETLYSRTLLLLQAIDKTKSKRSDLLPLVIPEWLEVMAHQMIGNAYYSQAVELLGLTQDPQKPHFKIPPGTFTQAVKARGDYLTSGDPARENNKRFFSAYFDMVSEIWNNGTLRAGLSSEQMQAAFHNIALFKDDKEVLALAKTYIQDAQLAGGIARGLKAAAFSFMEETPPRFVSAVDYYDFLMKSGQAGVAAEIAQGININATRILSGKNTNLPYLAHLHDSLKRKGYANLVDKLLDRVRDAGVTMLQLTGAADKDTARTNHVASLVDILDRTGQQETIRQMMAAAGETTRRLVFVPGAPDSQAKYVTSSVVMDIRGKNVLNVHVPQYIQAKDQYTRVMGYTRLTYTQQNIVSELNEMRGYWKSDVREFNSNHVIPCIIQGLVEQAALNAGKEADQYTATAKKLLDKIKGDKKLRAAYRHLWENKDGAANRPTSISTKIPPQAAKVA